MLYEVFLPSYPRRIAYMGLAVLLGATGISIGFLNFFGSGEFVYSLGKAKAVDAQMAPSLFFPSELSQSSFSFPVPRIHQEFLFSFDSSRPDKISLKPSVFVKMKKSSQSKQVFLPAQVNLEFLEGEKLRFVDEPSLFWMELDLTPSNKIEGKVFIETPLSEKIETESFIASLQEAPLQSGQDFSERSPFRILSEGKWLGTDKFKEKYENGAPCQKIELGASLIDLQEGDWLIWLGDRWAKGTLADGAQKPIARIKAMQGKTLIFEGWESSQSICLGLNHIASLFKMKGEELLSSIRVRSCKQISCMMEKQWMILKCGDWVLKTEGRWKVLKKQEEKELYKEGKLSGELFVFEKIESKPAQKSVQGQLFNIDRSQCLALDLIVPIHGTRRTRQEEALRKMCGPR